MKRENFISNALRNQEGTVYERMAVKPSMLLNETLSAPSLPEQQKVGALFSRLDDLIALHQRKLESLTPACIAIAQTSPDRDRITRSMSWFSSSWMMCR